MTRGLASPAYPQAMPDPVRAPRSRGDRGQALPPAANDGAAIYPHCARHEERPDPFGFLLAHRMSPTPGMLATSHFLT